MLFLLYFSRPRAPQISKVQSLNEKHSPAFEFTDPGNPELRRALLQGYHPYARTARPQEKSSTDLSAKHLRGGRLAGRLFLPEKYFREGLRGHKLRKKVLRRKDPLLPFTRGMRKSSASPEINSNVAGIIIARFIHTHTHTYACAVQESYTARRIYVRK